MKKHLIFIFILTVLVSCDQRKADDSEKPNIIFILIDDLGYTDLGCYGSTFYETPNIDQLAQDGVRFTNSYSASAVCSPTRASIMTGKYPARLKLTDWIGPDQWHYDGPLETPKNRDHLPLEEITLGDAFKNNGYSTCYIGKWHLGSPEYYPEHQGFDINIAGNDAGAPPSYFYPYINKSWEGLSWPSELKELQENGEEGEYLTDRLTEEAIRFIDTAQNKPFFLYLAYYTVHIPLQAKEEYIEKYRQKAKQLEIDSSEVWETDIHESYVRQVQNHPVYAGMVQSMDENVGRIRAYLEKQGLAENTIIVFTSDNGGYSTSNFIKENREFKPDNIPTSVKPLRTGKGWYFEGGIKIPTIIYQPGKDAPDEVYETVISTDFYPTLLEMAGLETLPEQHVDGISLLPLLTGEKEMLTRENVFWHYPHYHGYGEVPASAIRKGKYKLVYRYQDEKPYLYDLKNDVAEQYDLTEKLPGIKNELLKDLKNWLTEVDAELPGNVKFNN